LDKVTKRLGIELALDGKNPTPIVHCDASRRPYSGGRVVWILALRRYAFKLNLAIDGIRRQPPDEMEAIDNALDQRFDYLNYPLAYKFFKDQVAVLLKTRCGWLKKKIQKGEDHPWNCL
jgi:hypothetical protein